MRSPKSPQRFEKNSEFPVPLGLLISKYSQVSTEMAQSAWAGPVIGSHHRSRPREPDLESTTDLFLLQS